MSSSVGGIATAADVVARFNAVVLGPGLYGKGTAAWHEASFPDTPVKDPHLPDNLGPVAEPDKTADQYKDAVLGVGATGTLPPAAFSANTVFNIVHSWAQELTRVREARLVYFVGNYATAGITAGKTVCALAPSLAVHIPYPTTPMPAFDATPTAGEFTAFLNALRVKVNAVRNPATGGLYQQTFVACHSSCHSSCHGARGRR